MARQLGEGGYVDCVVCGRRCFMGSSSDDLNSCSSCDHFACGKCTTIIEIAGFPTPFCKKTGCQSFARDRKAEDR